MPVHELEKEGPGSSRGQEAGRNEGSFLGNGMLFTLPSHFWILPLLFLSVQPHSSLGLDRQNPLRPRHDFPVDRREESTASPGWTHARVLELRGGADDKRSAVEVIRMEDKMEDESEGGGGAGFPSSSEALQSPRRSSRVEV